VSQMEKSFNIYNQLIFFVFLGGLILFLILSSSAQAQIPSPYSVWSPFPSIFSFPFSTFAPIAPFSTALFYNSFYSPFAPPRLPALPTTSSPSASILGALIPPPPLPIATVAGTTVFAPTTITEVELRIWLEGPPISLVLPVPTTIYILPEATASGLLIPPRPIPVI